MKLPKMMERDFDAHFSVKHMLKDMQIASRLALSHQLELAVSSAARDLLLEQMDYGMAMKTTPRSSENISPTCAQSLPIKATWNCSLRPNRWFLRQRFLRMM